MTQEFADVLEAFDALKWKERKNSAFCGTKYERFGSKVEFLVTRLNPRFHKYTSENAKALFRFSSEVTHVGYISTLITSSDKGGIYLGGPDDCFLPSTENYAELQFRVVKICTEIVGDIYLRALSHALSRLAKGPGVDELQKSIENETTQLHKVWRGVGWVKMYLFISAQVVRLKRPISIKCMCSQAFVWRAPHWNWDLYCPSCGTTFRPVPIWSDFGYIVLPAGPADVWGSPQPIIDDLSPEDRGHLYSVWEEFREADEVKKFAGRPEIPLLFIKSASGFKRSMPPPRGQELFTFVSHEALVEGQGLPIMCNCSYVTLLRPPLKSDTIECWACGSQITLRSLSSEKGKKHAEDEAPQAVITYDPVTGMPGLAGIQGGFGKKLTEISKEEKAKMLEGIPPIVIPREQP